MDDDDGVGDDGLARHADEHDIGDKGVVQLAEGIASRRQRAEGLGGGGGPSIGAGVGHRQRLGGRPVHLDGLDRSRCG